MRFLCNLHKRGKMGNCHNLIRLIISRRWVSLFCLCLFAIHVTFVALVIVACSLVIVACSLLDVSSNYFVSYWRVKTDQNACNKIQQGMTQRDVENIIGGPPGNYSGLISKYDSSIPLTVVGSSTSKKWTGREGVIMVFFDQKARVMGGAFYFPPPK